MKKLLVHIMTLSMFVCSCAKAPVCQESLVPEIISITSCPEVNSVLLVSELKESPFGRVECGFYVGKDEKYLVRTDGKISGKTVQLVLRDLEEETVYYFKAFVSNGINEISSGFESFITKKTPVVPEPEPEPEPEPDMDRTG